MTRKFIGYFALLWFLYTPNSIFAAPFVGIHLNTKSKKSDLGTEAEAPNEIGGLGGGATQENGLCGELSWPRTSKNRIWDRHVYNYRLERF